MPVEPTDHLRSICMKLPEVTERETWGHPTYRIREKIFAMESVDGGQCAAWCKAPPGSQMVLIGADPDRYFSPPYVGPKGWIGIRLANDPDWREVEVLLIRSYCLIAPKQLARQIET